MASQNGSAPDPVIIAHTSDLHIGGRYHDSGHLSTLHAVIEAARRNAAHALILAGDIFDTHRAPDAVIQEFTRTLAQAQMHVVILPGNHDPATPEAVWRRGVADAPNVQVLGVNVDGVACFNALDLEISGVAHAAYRDIPPLDLTRRRSRRWHVAVAHGHWVRGTHDHHRAWLIHDDDLAAMDADYIALGHWDLPQPAGDGRARAYYSGSPELARTINIVRLGSAGIDVSRYPLELPAPG